MKFLKFLSFLFLLFSASLSAQKTISHKVTSGESVYSIAKKYNVTEDDIFELNPKAKGLLQLDMVLLVPKNSKRKSDEKKNKFVPKGPSHKVESGESLYTIAKKYDTSIEELREANPQLDSDNLQLGEFLTLPKGVKKQEEEKLSKAERRKIDKLQGKLQKHTVASGESFYVIAKKYNVSVDELKKVNPQFENGKLDVTDVVFIPGTEESKEEKVRKEKKQEFEKNQVDNTIAVQSDKISDDKNSADPLIHEVLPKETKYGISKRYSISIKELEQLNPKIVNGLSVGDKLVIREGIKKVDDVAAVSEEPAKDTASIEEKPVVEALPLSDDAAQKAEFLINKASENLGVRYRGGGTDRNGFDCSGLIFTTFKNIDMTLPRSSSDMAANSGVKIDKSQAQKGDLIFFATRGRWVGHVGMVTEVLEDEIKFIHSSTSSGVIISSTKEPYYAKRFVQINRVLN